MSELTVRGPTFTIITAVFNGAATIASALDSVARQTWPDVEHLIVDGGSADRTLEVVAAHGRRVSSVISERDRGIYDAFNKGVSLASGDVIGFLNADDFYASEIVIADVARVFMDARCDAVYGDAAFVAPDALDRVVRWYDSGAFHPRRIRFGVMPAHPSTFVKKHVFQRHGAFDISYRIAGDFEFVARTFGVAGISHAYLRELLVIMRTGGVSTSGLRSKQTISREIVRACRQNGIRSSGLHALIRYVWKARDWQRGRAHGVLASASGAQS